MRRNSSVSSRRVVLLLGISVVLSGCAALATSESAPTKTSFPTAVPTRTSPTSTPALTPTPAESRIRIGEVSLVLPEGWCWLDEVHISSFCPSFTGLPLAELEFNENEQGSKTLRDEINLFLKDFKEAGFQLSEVEFAESKTGESIGSEPYLLARVKMTHPKYDFPPEPHIIVAFSHNDKNVLIWGHLIQNEFVDSDYDYLVESLFIVFNSISFEH